MSSRSEAIAGSRFRTSLSGCNATRWLNATDHNTASKRILVVNSWSGVGIAHRLAASALWLQMLSYEDRAIRFAFCVPRNTSIRLNPRQRHLMPACEEKHFDLHEHLTFFNLRNLQASLSDFAKWEATGGQLLVSPRCAQIQEAVRSSATIVAILFANMREIKHCIRLSKNESFDAVQTNTPVDACLRHVQLAPELALPNPHATSASTSAA